MGHVVEADLNLSASSGCQGLADSGLAASGRLNEQSGPASVRQWSAANSGFCYSPDRFRSCAASRPNGVRSFEAYCNIGLPASRGSVAVLIVFIIDGNVCPQST
jgi:hypothetical protein